MCSKQHHWKSGTIFCLGGWFLNGTFFTLKYTWICWRWFCIFFHEKFTTWGVYRKSIFLLFGGSCFANPYPWVNSLNVFSQSGGLEHFLFFHSVGNVIIPTDFHSMIFQRGRAKNHQPVTCWAFLGPKKTTRICLERLLRMIAKYRVCNSPTLDLMNLAGWCPSEVNRGWGSHKSNNSRTGPISRWLVFVGDISIVFLWGWCSPIYN